MDNAVKPPVVYWVVGNRANVGKTTIASALIRVLTAEGKRVVGFKPYAGGQLHELIDFMIEQYPSSPCKLFGRDSWHLTTASPLTPESLVDVVVPVQFLCYPTWQSIVLMRTGSAILGNVEYYRSALGTELKDRADLRDLIDKTGLPLRTATARERISSEMVPKIAATKQAQAFEHLVSLGVDAVVCEGAGGWLPIWQGCPPASHVIFLADGIVNLFPNADTLFRFRESTLLRSVDELAEAFRASGQLRVSVPLFIVEQGRRDAVARSIVQALLDRVRSLSPNGSGSPARAASSPAG